MLIKKNESRFYGKIFLFTFLCKLHYIIIFMFTAQYYPYHADVCAFNRKISILCTECEFKCAYFVIFYFSIANFNINLT